MVVGSRCAADVNGEPARPLAISGYLILVPCQLAFCQQPLDLPPLQLQVGFVSPSAPERDYARSKKPGSLCLFNTVYNYSMKTEIQYQWRVRWVDRWVTTRYHCTEAQIRKDHPEAERIDASRRELLIAVWPPS